MSIDWSLIRRSIESAASPEEEAFVKEWLEESPEHRALYDDARAFYGERTAVDLSPEKVAGYKALFETRLAQAAATRRRRRRKMSLRIAAAVCIPLVAIGGAWLALSGRTSQEPILPGTMKAMIYSDSGEMIETQYGANAVPGSVDEAWKDSMPAMKRSSDQLAAQMSEQTYRMVVPRGAEYPLIMLDGTVIWLNSASELTYSVYSVGPERRVYLKGEAYFDVAPDPDRPFVIVTDAVEIKVYGTRFNVNTRAGDYVQTTVEEGSVSVRAGDSPEKMLKPNDMGQFDRTTGKIEIHQVNVAHYLSWKSGIYIFENKPIGDIMTELSMWYDVEVRFANPDSRRQRFSGSLPRNREIGELLNLIEKTTRAGFEIKGRTIIVE